jgi:hypothetical protein
MAVPLAALLQLHCCVQLLTCTVWCTKQNMCGPRCWTTTFRISGVAAATFLVPCIILQYANNPSYQVRSACRKGGRVQDYDPAEGRQWIMG